MATLYSFVQDISTDCLYLLRFRSSSYSLWGATQPWYRWNSTHVSAELWTDYLLSALFLNHFPLNLGRWKLEHSGDISIHCYLWDYPFHLWRAAPIDPWSCGTNCYYVHLFVQLCQGKTRHRSRTVLAVGWVVSKSIDSWSLFFRECMFCLDLYRLQW